MTYKLEQSEFRHPHYIKSPIKPRFQYRYIIWDRSYGNSCRSLKSLFKNSSLNTLVFVKELICSQTLQTGSFRRISRFVLISSGSDYEILNNYFFFLHIFILLIHLWFTYDWLMTSYERRIVNQQTEKWHPAIINLIRFHVKDLASQSIYFLIMLFHKHNWYNCNICLFLAIWIIIFILFTLVHVHCLNLYNISRTNALKFSSDSCVPIIWDMIRIYTYFPVLSITYDGVLCIGLHIICAYIGCFKKRLQTMGQRRRLIHENIR